jgi:hypothetical protein
MPLTYLLPQQGGSTALHRLQLVIEVRCTANKDTGRRLVCCQQQLSSNSFPPVNPFTDVLQSCLPLSAACQNAHACHCLVLGYKHTHQLSHH